MEEFLKERLAKFQKALASSQDSPVAFQALWDGDTNGWGLSLEVVYQYPTYHAHVLECFRFGSKHPLFNKKVVPLPEARAAQTLGRKLAQQYQVEFFFPSPQKPSENYPNWWEKNN